MANLLDSLGGKVKGGDGPQFDHPTRTITWPKEGSVKDTEGPEFEPNEIYDIHGRFLLTFESKFPHKLERGDYSKVVEDCLKQSYGGVDIPVDILGEASQDYSNGFQTILHLIPSRLRNSSAKAREDSTRSIKTGNFTGLFRYLMDRFPRLYSLSGEDSGSYHDFLQAAIKCALTNLNASSARGKKSDAVIINKKHAEDVQEFLKVFVCDFPEKAAELLQVGPIGGEQGYGVHDLLSLVEGFEKIELLFKALDVATILNTDGRGNTVLHRAAKYGTPLGPSVERTRALGIVQSLVEKCPQALKELNSDGFSPYRARAVEGKVEISRGEGKIKLDEGGDKVALFLKDQYIRYPLNEATDLLYGGAREPELYLNLEHLKDESVSEINLVSMLERLNLDTHLQFVRLPRFTVIPNQNQRSDDNKAPQEQLGSGRVDFGIVFRVLKKIGVQKILKIEVEDLDQPSHRDDIIIDSLKDFNIEEWDWRKLDLCTEVIGQTTQDVRQIRLYSSGNNAVLRGWSGKGGLRSFSKLENVHVTFKEGLVSEKTLEKYGNNFKWRIDKAWEKKPPKKFDVGLTFPDWGSSIASSQGGIAAGGGGGGVVGNPWIRDIGRISKFVRTVLRKDPEKREVKVAIIDDGIDLFNFEPGSNERGVHGCSFESDHAENPWYTSPGKHGTMMARLVRLVCPGSSLYIARLRLTSSHPSGGSPQFQPTAGSAAKAIDWAVGQDVDIISMSWTIAAPGGEEGRQLYKAINAARAKDILLFGTTYNENTYPVDSHDGIICIGGANTHGSIIPESHKDHTKFTFPSSGLGLEFKDAAGSSISTALAAGLAALILYCAEYTGPGESRRALKRGMTKVFKKMVEELKPQFVNPKLYFDPNDFNNREAEGVVLIREAIGKLTEAAKLLVASLISLHPVMLDISANDWFNFNCTLYRQ